MAKSGKPEQLTPRQRRAIAALLASRNVGEAAQAANVGRRSLDRWLADDTAFRAALAAAEGEALDAATRRLLALQDPAIDAMGELLQAEDTTPAVRLRAAQAVLDALLKLRELHSLENRVAELEAAIYGKSEQ